MKRFAELTKYISLIDQDEIGHWYIDRENDGTMEYPIQLPYVVFSKMINNFVDDVYTMVDRFSEWELNQSGGIVSEQVIRPTGLLDPVCEVRPTTHQVDDLLDAVKNVSGRVLVTTLTKKMAEQLTDYLNENGVRAKYLHSDIETLERIELLSELRLKSTDPPNRR